MKTMSLRQKITAEFSANIVILILISVISFLGINHLINLATQRRAMSRLAMETMQREIDHLHWANQLVAYIAEKNPGEMTLQTDPHKCVFGKWYYGEGKSTALKLVPELQSDLDALEMPHARVHASAQSIAAALHEPDGYRKAFEIYHAQTAPELKKVRELLNAITVLARDKNSSLNDAMNASSARTRWAIAAISVSAIVLAIILAFFLIRAITGPLNRIIAALSGGAEQTSSAAGQVSSSSQALAQGASEQALAVGEVGNHFKQMVEVTKTNVANAGETKSLAEKVKLYTVKGSEAMNKMTAAMDNIKTSSDETSKIVRTIDEIAFQTNLL
ncbi:MAG: hypothetical protein HGB26_05360, partial [Desulfobulbaceae bacterium]|nr:hypothetical protein [Desulfobulbaceae bacterium]